MKISSFIDKVKILKVSKNYIVLKMPGFLRQLQSGPLPTALRLVPWPQITKGPFIYLCIYLAKADI